MRWLGGIWSGVKKWALAEDMTGNMILLLAKPGQAMSLTFARWRTQGNRAQKAVGKRMCAMLDLADKGHCDKVLAAAEAKEMAKRGGGSTENRA